MAEMNPVVHFEMPYEDRDRMAEFYGKAFGWETNKLGPEMGNYVVAMTDKSDQNGPLEKGRINGGFYKKSKDNQYPSVVISVEDIQAAMEKVEESGGTIIGASKGKEPDNIPGVGLYISIQDTEGNRVGMLQPPA
jgi:uncharacterized protein